MDVLDDIKEILKSKGKILLIHRVQKKIKKKNKNKKSTK
jgi:hypothetical protein